MTRNRQLDSVGDINSAAIQGVPPLELLPQPLAKVITEIRELGIRQREALTAVNDLKDDASVEAAKAADRAEHARQIRAGKRGVVVQDAQRKLAQDMATAEHELDGVNAAIAAAYVEFWELRDKAHEDPTAAATARKLAKAVQTALDAFQKAYVEYDSHDMIRSWHKRHSYQPIKPFPLIELVTASRNGDRADRIGVDINDLVTNLKQEILNDSDI
jgi:hypothetical protein